MKRRMAWVCSTALWFTLVAVSAFLPAQRAVAQATSATATGQRPVSLVIVSTLAESYARSQVRAFERANPGVRVDLIVQRPEQILTTLRSATPAQRAHLIWSASTEGLLAAAADGLLLGSAGEPLAMGVTVPIDQGIAVRAQHMIRIALARRAGPGAPAWPERWQDLAQGDCSVRLVNPFAAAGGAGGWLIEAALQDLGWEAGWTLLSGLAARSTSAPNETAPLSFVFEEAMGEPGWEIMPAITLLGRTRLAMVAAGSRDMRMAQRFIRFMTNPVERSSAVEPSATGRVTQPGLAQYVSIDLPRVERREPMIGALTRQWLVAHAATLRKSCSALAQAQRSGGRSGPEPAVERVIAQARTKAYGPTLSESVLTDEAVVQAFSPQIREALRRPRVAALESQWASMALERHNEVMNLLAELNGAPGGASRSPARLTP